MARPYYQKNESKTTLNHTLKLSLTNIRGLHSNFVECESFLESNSPDIFTLSETNLDDSTDPGNFSVRGYLPLIRKNCFTHMDGLVVYVKKGLSFARNISRKLCGIFLIFSTNFTSFIVLLL